VKAFAIVVECESIWRRAGCLARLELNASLDNQNKLDFMTDEHFLFSPPNNPKGRRTETNNKARNKADENLFLLSTPSARKTKSSHYL
jgi:hypothetical protein